MGDLDEPHVLVFMAVVSPVPQLIGSLSPEILQMQIRHCGGSWINLGGSIPGLRISCQPLGIYPVALDSSSLGGWSEGRFGSAAESWLPPAPVSFHIGTSVRSRLLGK